MQLLRCMNDLWFDQSVSVQVVRDELFEAIQTLLEIRGRFLIRIKAFAMTSDRDAFIPGATAFRNARNLA